MYDLALKTKVATPFDFWSYSIDEIDDLLKAYEFSEYNRKKEQAIFNNVLSMQIIEGIAMLFDKDKKIKPKLLEDYFPDLFKHEETEEEKQKRIKAETEAYKEQFRDFAKNLNKMRRG